jgi:hypothetical protein
MQNKFPNYGSLVIDCINDDKNSNISTNTNRLSNFLVMQYSEVFDQINY